jgi:hypothetical protein
MTANFGKFWAALYRTEPGRTSFLHPKGDSHENRTVARFIHWQENGAQ